MPETINRPKLDIHSDTIKNLIESSKNADICEEQLEQLNKSDEDFINDHNEEVSKSPEYRGMIMYNNYIQTQQAQGVVFTGSQKRTLRRKFVRDAKKGKYDYLFDEEKIRRHQERATKDLESLNKPHKHSVNDLDDKTKEALLKMETEEKLNEVSSENEK